MGSTRPFVACCPWAAGLEVETADERAWVGLVPFRMAVGLANPSGLPWLGRFCETNVRTYVRDEHGRSGRHE